MKKIEFNKIQVQNFLSYGNTPTLVSFEKGITFITGYNKDDDSRNGVGKTSLIVESLSFVLFGKTYRKITQDEIRNRCHTNNCSVTVWYTVNDVQYEVTRSLSPNTLTRTVVGNTPETKTIPETTKDILNDLGITKEVFENTLVMTAKNSKSFFSQDKSLKTKFIEGILGLECFSDLFKSAKDEYNTLNALIGKSEATLNATVKLYDADLSYQTQWDNTLKEKIVKLQDAHNYYISLTPIDRTDEITTTVEQIKTLKESVKTKDDTVQKLSSKALEVKFELERWEKQLKKTNSSPTTCPTCNRPFDVHSETDIKSEIDNINTQISEFTEKKNKITTALTKIRSEIANINGNIKQAEDLYDNLTLEQDQFAKSQEKIAVLIEKITETQAEVNPFLEKNENTLANLDTQRNNLEKDRKRLRILDGVRIVFSPTGVKSVVIKKIMDVFNERFGFYLEKLKTPCKIIFDEFFDEKVTSLSGEEISYDSMSEGEKGRVNFSLLFAFRDIRRLQSSVTINLSVFDELFDSSIDASAAEQILDLLAEMSEEHNDSYYIITHNTGNVNISNAKIIYLEKENGLTSIVDS